MLEWRVNGVRCQLSLLFPALIITSLLYSRKVRPLYRANREFLSHLNHGATENIDGNRVVKAFAENTPNCYYLDTLEYAPLDRKDIYVEDGVHFNQAGYDIYAEFFKEALKDELAAF